MKDLSRRFLVFILLFALPACSGGGNGEEDADTDAADGIETTDGTDADSETPGDMVDDDGGGETTATAVIGVEGGSLTSTDGLYTIEVQPGTVEEDTTFTIELIADPAEGVIGPSYRLGPEDVEFNLPIFSTLAYDPAELGDTAEQDLWLVTWDADEGVWMPDNRSFVSTDDNELLGERMSFSEVSKADIARALQALAAGCSEIEDIPETIYVDAENGDDETVTGSEDSPFESLETASRRLYSHSIFVDQASHRCYSYRMVDEVVIKPGQYGDVASIYGGRGPMSYHGEAGKREETVLHNNESLMILISNIELADLTVHYGVQVSSAKGTLRNLHVTMPMPGVPGLVKVQNFEAEDIQINDCLIDCDGSEVSGIYIVNHGAADVTSLTISGNTVTKCDPGIYIWGVSGSASFSGNTIINNGTGVGVYNTEGSLKGKWEDNSITGNDNGVWIISGANAVQDFGGGESGSAGGNTLSCNETMDVLSESAFTLHAQSCFWDHDPPQSPDGDPAGNDYEGDVDFEGNALADDPCDGVLTCEPLCTPDGLWHSADGHVVYGCPEEGVFGGMAGWQPDTGDTWIDTMNGGNDAYPDAELNDMVIFTPVGPLLTSMDATGQVDGMAINFFGTSADFGLGAPQDFWMLYGSSTITVARGGYASPDTTDNFTIPDAGLRFGRYIPGVERFAAADTDAMMMYLVDDADGNVAYEWSTTWPVFRLAAAGMILVYTTNEGVFEGDPANSALVVVNADTGETLDTITVTGGDFWGVDAILNDATGDVLFAAGTGSDGLVLGMVDDAGETCHREDSSFPEVKDAGFAKSASGLSLATTLGGENGLTNRYFVAPVDIDLCPP